MLKGRFWARLNRFVYQNQTPIFAEIGYEKGGAVFLILGSFGMFLQNLVYLVDEEVTSFKGLYPYIPFETYDALLTLSLAGTASDIMERMPRL